MRDWDPLTGPLPPEVPLARAPLVRVIAQIRFPTVASIERTDAIAPFQEAIRSRYTVLRSERTQDLMIGIGTVQATEPQLVWRFSETQDVTGWTLSLASNFLALSTATYTSRDDFMGRLTEGLAALEEIFKPSSFDRIGVRYIDRILGEDLGHVSNFIHTGILGVAALPVGEHSIHAVSDALFSMDDAHLRARWGFLPPRATLDVTAIESVDEKSWILDLDAFTDAQDQFKTELIAQKARYLAERIYAFFRWSVTDEFLRYFGGKL
jgi:uncharacterized protein (TIGR04255 family)